MAVMGVSVLTTVIPLMVDHFKDAPYSQYLVPILMTLPSLWILLFSPIAGWLADRFGRRRIVIVAMFVYAFFGTMPVYLDNIYAIMLSRCGVGICESIVMTVTTTMISDYFHGHAREKWLAGQTAVASLSALIIIPLGGFLASVAGWRGPFYLYAFSLILVFGVILYTWEPEKSDHVIEGSTVSDPDIRYHELPWARLISLCALTVIAAVMFYAIVTQNGNAMNILGVTDPARSGLFTDVCSIGVPVGTILYRYLARMHIGYLVCLDFLLTGIGFWGMGHSLTPYQYTGWAFINQVGCGLLLPTMLVWTTRGLAYAIRGRGNGMWQGSFAIGQFVSGVAITFFGVQLGGLLGAFRAIGMVALGVAIAALIAKFIWGKRAYQPSNANAPLPGH
jgi:MFS family permease